MTVPVMTMEVHELVSSPSNWIDLLATFATSQGWNVIEKQNSKYWGTLGGGVYEFLPDTYAMPGHFLMMESAAGYQVRIYPVRLSTTLELQYIQIGTFPRGATYNTASPTHPEEQTPGLFSCLKSRHPILFSNIPRIWFFGDRGGIIYVIFQFNNYLISSFAFGIHDIIDTSSHLSYAMQLNSTFCIGTTGYSSNIAALATNTYYGGMVGAIVHNVLSLFYYTSELPSTSNIVYSVAGAGGFYSSGSTSNQGLGYYGGISPITNGHSSLTPLWRVGVSIKDPTDATWFFSGHLHHVQLVLNNAPPIGTTLFNGSEQYVCFPFKRADTDTTWYGLRIK